MRVSALPTKRTWRACRSGRPLRRVDHGAEPVCIKRVHREVAALGVFLDVGRVGDHGAAAVGFDVAAEGGDFVRFTLCHNGHCAVVDAGGDRLETARFLQG